MKIAVITGRGFEIFGGIESYIEEVYGCLAESGHKIIVYSRKIEQGCDRTRVNNIENRILPYLKIRHLDILSHCIISVIDTWLRDVDIICYHGSPAALASCLPVRPNVKKIVVFHGLDWKNRIFNRFFKLMMQISEIIGSKCSDQVVVVSEYLKEYFLTRHHTDAIHIPPGGRCYSQIPPRKILSLGLEKDKYILFLGRMTPEKGCHLLIQAYKSINTEMKLVMAGPVIFNFNEPYYRYLRKIANNDNRIIFTGAVKRDIKGELLSNAYIVVYPSLVGGLPLVVLEAMGYKKCVLVSTVCDYYKVIREYSVLFKTGDQEDLSGKLRLLLGDPVKCNEFGRMAQDYISAKLSWQDTALKFEDVFYEIKNNGHGK